MQTSMETNQSPLVVTEPATATLPEQEHTALIAYISRKEWWHVPTEDPQAYQKRGKFYASTYSEAEFYGRPGDPERVKVKRPFVTDNDTMETAFFGAVVSSAFTGLNDYSKFLEARFELDARIKEEALAHGYDSIVLLSPKGYARYLSEGKIPRSIELNILLP